MKRLNKLFVCEIEGYDGGIWRCVCDTEKTLKLKCLEDLMRSYFDKDEILTQKKDNRCKHSWREFEDDFVIYPFRAGVPYYFKPLTKEYLEVEIKSCEEWGVSAEYFENLLEDLTKKVVPCFT